MEGLLTGGPLAEFDAHWHTHALMLLLKVATRHWFERLRYSAGVWELDVAARITFLHDLIRNHMSHGGNTLSACQRQRIKHVVFN